MSTNQEPLPISHTSDTVRLPLSEAEKQEYLSLKDQHKALIEQENQKRAELLKRMEPRNQFVEQCITNCAKLYPESKKAKEHVQKQTKETLLKQKLTQFDLPEFRKNFIFGLNPVLGG